MARPLSETFLGTLRPVGACSADVVAFEAEGRGRASHVGGFDIELSWCLDATTGEIGDGNATVVAGKGDRIDMTLAGQAVSTTRLRFQAGDRRGLGPVRRGGRNARHRGRAGRIGKLDQRERAGSPTSAHRRRGETGDEEAQREDRGVLSEGRSGRSVRCHCRRLRHGWPLAAALLARYGGRRVLVLERHYTPGGFTHVFRRPGYEWDVGVHYIGDVQRGTMLRALFDDITDGRLDWADMGQVYDRIVLGEERFDLPAGREPLRRRLKERFPAESDAIDAYLALVRRWRRTPDASSWRRRFRHRSRPDRAPPPAALPAPRAADTREVLESLTSDASIGLLTASGETLAYRRARAASESTPWWWATTWKAASIPSEARGVSRRRRPGYRRSGRSRAHQSGRVRDRGGGRARRRREDGGGRGGSPRARDRERRRRVQHVPSPAAARDDGAIGRRGPSGGSAPLDRTSLPLCGSDRTADGARAPQGQPVDPSTRGSRCDVRGHGARGREPLVYLHSVSLCEGSRF